VRLRRALTAALVVLAAACDPKGGAAGDGGAEAGRDGGRAKDAGSDAAAAAKGPPFAPVPGAAAGPAWLLSKSHGLLGIDGAGKRTLVPIADARVLAVATLTGGDTIVVESKGLRKIVGKIAHKVHAFGERMAADVEEGAMILPGPNGAISVLGAKRLWIGGKPGWKGTGRSAVVAVARDRMADADAAGTPLVWGIDTDDALRLQNGESWDVVAGMGPGLLVRNAVLDVAPAAAGGVFVLREDGLYRLPSRTEPAATVASFSSAKGARLAVSSSGVVAVRDPSGSVVVVAPTGEVATPAPSVGDPFAVDDLGRVWSAGEGAVTVLTPAGTTVKLPRTADMTDLAGIAVTGAGPSKERLGR